MAEVIINEGNFEEVVLKADKPVIVDFFATWCGPCRQMAPILESFAEEFDGKYSIFRLYKGNEPTPGRVIGKLVNKVFYIFYIDVKGILYNHGH